MIRIILAEDHTIVRNGIKGILETESDIQVVGLAENGNQVLEMLSAGIEADLVLSDISMPDMDGMVLLKHIRSDFQDIPVIMLSMFENEKFIFDAFELGASGYLLKNTTSQELVYCIKRAMSGVKVICSEIGQTLLKLASKNSQPPAVTIELSDRELEILELISHGYTNQEIADRVFASRRTVEGHRQTMVIKAGVKNTAELVRFACKNGLI